MAFDREEIFEELASSVGGRREWFDSAGYSFQRLGRVDNRDLSRLANLLRYQRWAKANPERARAISRAYYQRHPERMRELGAAKRKRQKADPWAHAKRLASYRAYRDRKKDDLEHQAKLAAQAREKYALAMSDPAKREARRRADQARYLRRKAAKAR